ncbi:MAG TPA: hypothetical protein VMS88_08495, partial [Terriglobales bacterium]|nr:hypothetical protein [Terriglobales bacterium]
NVRNGLPLLLALWPLLALARIRGHPRAQRVGPGFDRVEALTCALFSSLLLAGQRFMGLYALAAAVYVARDLDEWARGVRLPRRIAAPWVRAALAAAACVLVTWPDMSRPEYAIRLRVPGDQFPVAACDFIQRHDLHGRFFNQYDFGGYLCFRFWPRRDQLPFMGIHQEGSRELRDLYMSALSRRAAWRELNERCRFDVLVLIREPVRGDHLLQLAERDTAWARVFADDAACVYVRPSGPFADLAADSAYHALPADPGDFVALARARLGDPALRGAVERELWREAAGSPAHAQAMSDLSDLAYLENRPERARRFLEEALRIAPLMGGVREKLGLLALAQGRPREALRWFEEEWRIVPWPGGLDFHRGQVAAAEGDLQRARDSYERELRRDPANEEARDSLAALDRRERP